MEVKARVVPVPTQAGRPAVHRFEVLDSLRGVCAILVVLYHFPAGGHVTPLAFIRGSYMFVDFFFVLSGFVIAYSYGNRIRDADGLLVFMVRRFFRLWPLHLFVLALYLAVEAAATPAGMALGERNGLTLPDLIRTVTLTNGIGLDHISLWNVASWSISAEWWTYLAFGLLALALPRRLWAGLLALAALGAAVSIATHDSIRITSDWGLMRCFFGFGLGALLAGQWPRVQARLAAVPRAGLAVAEVVAIIGIVGFVAMTRLSPWSFLAPFVFTATVALFAMEAGPVSRLLSGPVFVRAGILSYSIYMVHQFVMARVRNLIELGAARGFRIDTGNAWQIDLLTLFMLVLVCVMAEFTYRLVERPGQALGAGLVGWMRRGARPA